MNRLLLLRATRGTGVAGSGSGGGTRIHTLGSSSSILLSPFRLDMSIFRRFISQGRELIRYHLQVYCNSGKGNNLSTKLDPLVNSGGTGTSGQLGRTNILPRVPNPGQNGSSNVAHHQRSPGPFVEWIGQEIHATFRQIFVNNVLKRVTSSLSGDLRKKATQQLLYGNNSRPFFALVGVSLASGAGMLTKENEFEGICWEIRESFEKKQNQIDQLAKASISPPPEIVENEDHLSVDNLKFGTLIAKGCSAAVYSAKWNTEATDASSDTEANLYPLGVKMMFNFYCESNSAAIVRAMCKEVVPARNVPELAGVNHEELENLQRCPPHPNIIEISHVFTDQIPLLPESMERYPDALPTRLNTEGSGRNMSLFLVMKRYNCNLQTYIRTHSDLKLKNRLLILAQLLEGVSHLTKNEIAHRDLKSDNILLDISGDPKYPHLVITDFGCCLASKTHGLLLPFPTAETDRGGNAALMAPEVSTAKPGTWRKISYEKSDAWSCGAIAYEILGNNNPFNSRTLDSRTYEDSDLPLIADVPPIINAIVHGLLRRRTYDRLSAEIAATVCHISLFAPTRWLNVDSDNISDSEIMQWLLTLTTKLLCQTPSEAMKLEFILIRTFLRRLRFSIVRAALDWIHSNAIPK